MRVPWVRNGLFVFVLLSAWVPFMAFCTAQPTGLDLTNIAIFEVVLALIAFGFAGLVHLVQRTRS
jgi:hypothetical protein